MLYTPEDHRLATNICIPLEIWGVIMQKRRAHFLHERVRPLEPVLERTLWSKRYMAFNSDDGKYAWSTSGLAKVRNAMRSGPHTIELHNIMSSYLFSLAQRLNGNIYNITTNRDISNGITSWQSYRYMMFLLPPPDVQGVYSFRFTDFTDAPYIDAQSKED